MGLYADNIGLLWVAVEGATISATLGVSLPRTASALEAAWKYFILGGVGIALALFGTMVTYLAAQPALGPGLPAMSFIALTKNAAHLDGPLMTLAFVFLLFGYGTKAALVPLHGWLPGCLCGRAGAAERNPQRIAAERRSDCDFAVQAFDAGEFFGRWRCHAAGTVFAHPRAGISAADRLQPVAAARQPAGFLVFRLLNIPA